MIGMTFGGMTIATHDRRRRLPRPPRPLGWLLVCAAVLAGINSQTALGAIVARDDGGRDVRLSAPATRIVSLAPHLTELLFEIGAEGAIVGTVAHSDYPPAAKAIPRVGDARATDLERVVTLQPDLILAWGSGNSRRAIHKLRSLGYAVFESEPRRLVDIPSTLERLGVLTSMSARAILMARTFNERLVALAWSADDRAIVDVFYQVWHPPLMSLNRQHIVSDALRICGGVNVASGAPRLVPRLSLESIITANPRAIIVAVSGSDDRAAMHWRQWQTIRAVADNAVFVVPADVLHRHTSRILVGIDALCGHLSTVRGKPVRSG